jgi:hypothetical protein
MGTLFLQVRWAPVSKGARGLGRPNDGYHGRCGLCHDGKSKHGTWSPALGLEPSASTAQFFSRFVSLNTVDFIDNFHLV